MTCGNFIFIIVLFMLCVSIGFAVGAVTGHFTSKPKPSPDEIEQQRTLRAAAVRKAWDDFTVQCQLFDGSIQLFQSTQDYHSTINLVDRGKKSDPSPSLFISHKSSSSKEY